MELGSVPNPPKKPRSSTRTQSARHSDTSATRPPRPSRGRPLSSRPPMVARATTAKRLTAHPWAATKDAEGRDPRREEARLRGSRHRADHAGQRPAAALPEPSSRPGLQHGHADQEQPAQCEHDAAETGGGVGPFGQGDEDAGDAIEEDGTRELRRARSAPGRRGRRTPRRRTRPRGPSRPTPIRRTETTGRVGRPATTGRSRPGSTRWPTPPGSDGSTRW